MGWEAVEGKELRQAAEYTSKPGCPRQHKAWGGRASP